MALVDYPSSDSDEDDAQVQTQCQPDYRQGEKPKDKPKDTPEASALPPLPAKFHDLYASTARVSTSDDPNLHGGRKRVTPHVEGNWPTHLYIECKSWSCSLVLLRGPWFTADTVEGSRRQQNMQLYLM